MSREEVDEIEGLEDIADAALSVQVEGAIEDDIFCLEGVCRRHQADHAVGDGDRSTVSRIDVGADGPTRREGLCRQEREGRARKRAKKRSSFFFVPA